MPIINKGIFDTGDAFLRQTGNDWPTAQVISTADVIESSSNLYFTNTRAINALTIGTVTGNIAITGTLIANGLIIRNIAVSDSVLTGSTAANNIVADTVTSNIWNRLYTANVIETAGNLYFTNARVAANVATLLKSFQGSGLVIDSANGLIDILPATVANTVLSLAGLTTTNLNEGSNLYFSNTRVFDAVTIGTIPGSLSVTGNLVANGLIIRNIAVSDSVLTGSTSANNIIADSITSNTWNRLYTANVVETSANLYFTNTRARAAFTAGRGIILMSDGTIKSTIGTETFNTGIDGGRSYSITTSMNGITFTSSNAGDRLILRSLHVTNVTDNPAYISSNVLYAGGNTAYLGNLIPVPVGSIVEFMDRPQIIQPNDTINLQAFNQNQTPANNILQAYFTYETIINDTTYVGTGHTLATSNANILITTADQSDTVFESIKFVNLKPYSIGVKTFFGDPNGIPRSYLAYNLQVPPNSSIEVLQSPKLLKFLDTLYVSYANASNGDAIAVFPSYRRTAVTTPYASTSSAVAQGSIQAAFNTTIIDGSTLYYTLE